MENMDPHCSTGSPISIHFRSPKLRYAFCILLLYSVVSCCLLFNAEKLEHNLSSKVWCIQRGLLLQTPALMGKKQAICGSKQNIQTRISAIYLQYLAWFLFPSPQPINDVTFDTTEHLPGPADHRRSPVRLVRSSETLTPSCEGRCPIGM